MLYMEKQIWQMKHLYEIHKLTDMEKANLRLSERRLQQQYDFEYSTDETFGEVSFLSSWKELVGKYLCIFKVWRLNFFTE